MLQNDLKEQLVKVKENDYNTYDGLDTYKTALSMLEQIGDTDYVLRDELIYPTFFYWIIEKKYFNSEQLRYILKTTIDDEHLFYKAGNSDDDSVFTRAFSVLLIPILLERHKLNNVFNDQEIASIKERVFLYYRKEKDYRGYVKQKGWAHSIAHGADALDSIAQFEFATHSDLLTILDLFKLKIRNESFVYMNEEDERMVNAIMSILKRNKLDNQEFVAWITDFSNITITKEYPSYHYYIVNVKGLLRSLYFRLLKEEEANQEYLLALKNTLMSISSF